MFWQIDDTSSDEWCRRCDLWECFPNPGHRCSKTWVFLGSRSAFIGRDIGKWSASWSDLREWAPMLIRELQEINGLLSQIDILQQKLIKFWSRDPLICNNGLGNGSTTPPGVEFWRIEIRFYPAGHKKNEKRTRSGFAGPSVCGVKMKFLKKSSILAGLLRTIEPGQFQSEQH